MSKIEQAARRIYHGELLMVMDDRDMSSWEFAKAFTRSESFGFQFKMFCIEFWKWIRELFVER